MEKKRIPLIKKILKDLKEDIENHPEYADLHNQLGILLFMVGKDEEGGKHLLKAVNINPRYWSAIINLSFYYLKKKMWREAEKVLPKDSITKDRDISIHFFIAKFYITLLKLKEDFLKIIGSSRTEFSRKGCYPSGDTDIQKKIFIIYQRVESLIKEIIENHFEAQCHNIVGIYLAKHGKASHAIRAFKESSSIKADDFTLHVNLAKVYYFNGSYQRAIQEYKKAIKINPNYGMGYAEISYIYGLMKKMKDALRYMEKAVEINPDYADLHYNLAILYSDMKNYSKAIEEFKKALRINPNYIFARINLGDLYEEQDMFKEAKREYMKVLKINPKDEHVRMRLERISKGNRRNE